MHSLSALWLPILLSAVAVFILSSVMHMVLPWHRSDYPKLPDEARVLDALRPLNIPQGEYMAPRPDQMSDMKSPAFLEKMNRGPVIILNVAPNGMASMGRPLVLWFIYLLIVDTIAGHVAGAALGAAAGPKLIFHTTGLTSLLGYSAALWQGTIWYRRPAMTTFKSTIDGLIYAIVTGLIFVWLWPQ